MKRYKKILIILAVVIGLATAYWLISPLFINKKVSEKLTDIMPPAGGVEVAMETIKSGKFVGLAGHSAEGTAKLLRVGDKYYARLEDDFKVTNGPDVFVYFGKNGAYVASAQIGS